MICKIASIINILVSLLAAILILNIEEMTFFSLATISIIQLVIHLVLVVFLSRKRLCSISVLFIVFSWIFHCGQIILLGYNIQGNIYLKFTLYGSYQSQIRAFVFYFLSQAFLVSGICFSKSKSNSIVNSFCKNSKIVSRLAVVLLVVGFIPRIFYDFVFLKQAMISGYHGTAVVYIPQFVNSLAFFADIGSVILLFLLNQKRKKISATLWFALVLIYKGFTMLSGNRQEAFAFLIIWIIIYLFILNETKLITTIIAVVFAYFGLTFVMSIGVLRSTGISSTSVLFTEFRKQISGSMIGSILGEFGSAFTTLVKTVEDTGTHIGFGYGKSYIAGFLSFIPALVNAIPALKGGTAYIVQFSNVSSFGGSYLGELYYNFSYFGVAFVFVLGYCIANFDRIIAAFKKNRIVSFNLVMSISISISILLFVRGYFSDMVQKNVWLAFVILLVTIISHEKEIKVRKNACTT